MVGRSTFIILAGPIVILMTASAIADSCELHTGQDSYELSKCAEILEDVEKKWTFGNILTPDIASQFKQHNKSTLALGYSNSAFWVQIGLQNKNRNVSDFLLEIDHPFDSIIFYQETEAGFLERETGFAKPFAEKQILHRSFLFPIHLGNGQATRIHLRVENRGSLNISPVLWPRNNFQRKDRFDQLFRGAYFGILAIMAFYNLFVFL
jgi:hypothetical protein